MTATVTRLPQQAEAPVSFEVIGRYGNTVATANTLEAAKQDAFYRVHSLGMTGITVCAVERIERRTVLYRPRKLEPVATTRPEDIETLLATASLETQP